MLQSIYYPLYTVHLPRHWLIRDEPVDRLYTPETEKSSHTSMIFHLSAGDYITTLTTILRFFEETIRDGKATPEMRELQLKKMKELMSDLLYLNRHYEIVPKGEKD